MTSGISTASAPLRTLRIGVLIAVLVTVADVVGMIAIGLPNAPVEVNVITSVLAVATIVGGVWAWRGAAWGVWLAAASRAISALSLVPLLVVPEAPRDAVPMSIVLAVLAVVAIVLMMVGLARRPRRAVAS